MVSVVKVSSGHDGYVVCFLNAAAMKVSMKITGFSKIHPLTSVLGVPFSTGNDYLA